MRPPLKIIAAWLVLRKTKLIIWYSIASAATRTVLFLRRASRQAVTRWAASVILCAKANLALAQHAKDWPACAEQRLSPAEQ